MKLYCIKKFTKNNIVYLKGEYECLPLGTKVLSNVYKVYLNEYKCNLLPVEVLNKYFINIKQLRLLKLNKLHYNSGKIL